MEKALDIHPEHLVELTLADGRVVYMRTDGEHNVVWVTGDELVMLWRRSFQQWEADLAASDAAVWRKDRKFANAGACFAVGRSNPIPLADVVLNERTLSVAFTNGITRTIWLLANGAARFPIGLSQGDQAAFERVVEAVRQLPESERYSVDRTPTKVVVGVVEEPSWSRWLLPVALVLVVVATFLILPVFRRAMNESLPFEEPNALHKKRP